MPYIVIVYLIAAYFLSWWPFDETDRAIQDSDFNVYFYYPDGNEKYLGQVTGLSSCGGVASHHASSKNIQSSNWSYVCCRIADGSSCKTKHR